MEHRIQAAWRGKFGPLPSKRDGLAEATEWLDLLDVQIPKPEPIALRWSDCAEIPMADATDDDIIIEPDHPTRSELAGALQGIFADAARTFPGPWHPSRWKTTSRFYGYLYTSGIASSGSSSTTGADPVGGWVYGPPRFRGRRCYLAWKPRWWWECLLRQVRCNRRIGHLPARPYALGICAKCMPCPECGAAYDCPPTCSMVGG